MGGMALRPGRGIGKALGFDDRPGGKISINLFNWRAAGFALRDEPRCAECSISGSGEMRAKNHRLHLKQSCELRKPLYGDISLI
jgi:hypothetical protein